GRSYKDAGGGGDRCRRLRRVPVCTEPLRQQPGAAAIPGRNADPRADRGSGDGIDGAILETGVGSVGTVLEAGLREAGRRKPQVGNATSGAGPVESWAARAQEGFSRRRKTGQAVGGARADPELCARSRTTSVACADAAQVSGDAQSGTAAEPTGSSSGRNSYEAVQSSFRSVGGQRAAHAPGTGGG